MVFRQHRLVALVAGLRRRLVFLVSDSLCRVPGRWSLVVVVGRCSRLRARLFGRFRRVFGVGLVVGFCRVWLVG